MKDIQRSKWQLTINNPETNGFNHLEIRKTLIDNFPTLKYFCMADEKGEEGTPHTHVFIALTSRVRFNKLKKHFPTAHIEATKGSVDQNINYIKKEGEKYADKAHTKINDTFEDWGEKPPNNKSINWELNELYELIKAGYTTGQIVEENPDYILYLDKIDRLRLTMLTEQYKEERRLNLKVIYISGATATGKTRGTLDKYGDSNCYRITDYKHPYDSYICQPVLIYDEFRSQLSISHMLDVLDIYPMSLNARYSNKYACHDTAVVISNLRLEEQYADAQTYDPETWKAFLRRIHHVKHFNEDGTIEVYNSVQDYFDRILSTESKLSDEHQEVIEELKSEVTQ
jgi:hypothetical protein